MQEFDPGDHVRLKSNVYDEGIVLARSDDPIEKNNYWVVFCQGTEYNSRPWVRLIHSRDISLIEKQVHKPKDPPRFKK